MNTYYIAVAPSGMDPFDAVQWAQDSHPDAVRIESMGLNAYEQYVFRIEVPQ